MDLDEKYGRLNILNVSANNLHLNFCINQKYDSAEVEFSIA